MDFVRKKWFVGIPTNHSPWCFRGENTELPICIAKSAEIECNSGMFSKEISKIGLFFLI